MDYKKLFKKNLIPIYRSDIVLLPKAKAGIKIKNEEDLDFFKFLLDNSIEHFILFPDVELIKNPLRKLKESNVGIVCLIEFNTPIIENFIFIKVVGLDRTIIEKKKRDGKIEYCKINLIDNNKIEENERERFKRLLKEDFLKLVAIEPTLNDIKKNIIQSNSELDIIDQIFNTNIFYKEDKYEILTEKDATKRVDKALQLINEAISILSIKNRVITNINSSVFNKKREAYITQQIEALNNELNSDYDEFRSMQDKIENLKTTKENKEKATRELARLKKLQQFSPEAGILRFYLETFIDIPWGVRVKAEVDIQKAQEILDNDHYDLKKVKDRILDYIAISIIKKNNRGPILCFVGPPGTGKTSLAYSVAKALNKNFIKIALGGIKDEAEIRGHRKTYVGAMPGKIINSLIKAKSINPVFLLDEIDKISSSYSGDPSSALLEVLDPEQNKTFTDHYIEVPIDLSEILFIATANSVTNIPLPLLDRMEVIEVPGYSDFEKLKIAQNFIIPKQLKENGFENSNIKFSDDVIKDLINLYTRESGVRNLEREIASAIRKCARKIITEKLDLNTEINVEKEDLLKFLGKPKFSKEFWTKTPKIGIINGLAWTVNGGTMLPIEAVLIAGKGDFILTGNLGEVMKESCKTAFSFIKSNYEYFNIDDELINKFDIHIHVPEGAIPKDGPSAGISLAAAIFSCLTKKITKDPIAMTGEITLTGKILPIGGVKEKVMAAFRNNIDKVVLPAENKNDIDEIEDELKNNIDFIFVETGIEAINYIFDLEKK